MSTPELVAVEATEERYRVLKHVPSGLGFDADGKGVWPADQFTYRLREEGALRIVPQSAAATDAKPVIKAKEG